MPESKHPWPISVLEKEWPKVKKAPFSFFLCILTGGVLGGVFIFFLYSQFIVTGLQNDNHRLERDNGKLSQQNDALKADKDALSSRLSRSEFSWLTTNDIVYTNTINPQTVSQIVLPDAGWYSATMIISTTNTPSAGVQSWFGSSESGMLCVFLFS